MAIPCNKLTLSVVAPVNGIIVNPGFHTEYSGRDWDNFESRYVPAMSKEAEAKLSIDNWAIREEIKREVKENLWAEKNSGAIILRPNVEPVDMLGAAGKNPTGVNCFRGQFNSLKKADGCYYAYGGDWANLVVPGNPKVQVLYQNTVQVKVGEQYIAQPWMVYADPTFKVNQGVTVWVGKNALPENEENEFIITLGDVIGNNGIKVEIKSGKAVRMCHWIDVANPSNTGKWNADVYKGIKESVTQWVVEDLPAPKAVYDWPEPYTVYTLFIVGRWVFFGINGLEQTIAMECQNYDLDTDGNPIVLREKAALWIEGKGQAGIGFKKMVYNVTGRLETPLEFPGYKLTNPEGVPEIEASSFIKPEGTDIFLQGLAAGASKAGGGVQKGPLGDTDTSYGVYGSVCLTGRLNSILPPSLAEGATGLQRYEFLTVGGKPVLFWIDYDGFAHAVFPSDNITQVFDTLSVEARAARNKLSYLSRVAEVTPVLFRFKISDRLTRTTVNITSPTPPASGDCLYFNHSWNIDGEGTFLGAISGLGIMSKDGLDYQDWLEACAPDVDITMQHREAATGLKICRYTMHKQGFGMQGVNEYTLEMSGNDLVKDLSDQEMKETRSYDDKNWTYAQLMTELCFLFGVTVHIAAGVGTAFLPKSTDANAPFWTFTPGTKRWEALNRLRKRAGGILYPDENNELQWKAKPTSASAANYTFTRGTSTILEPKIWTQDVWRTRIFVRGKAGGSFSGVNGYQKDDILVGAWFNKTLENKIGRTREHTETDASLADWAAIQQRGDELFAVSTSPGTYFSMNIPEALLGAQDCRKILPGQVFLWRDPLATKYDNTKFMFTSFSGANAKFTASAEIEGQLLP